MDMNVLFIDDDKATNFFNKRVAKNSDLFQSIAAHQDPKKVIDCLGRDECVKDFVKPDLIFLDINMPAMTGWEFLEAFYNLSDECKKNIKIVMLSTSNEEEKAKRLNKAKTIIGYAKKPLRKEYLDNIANVYKSFFDGK